MSDRVQTAGRGRAIAGALAGVGVVIVLVVVFIIVQSGGDDPATPAAQAPAQQPSAAQQAEPSPAPSAPPAAPVDPRLQQEPKVAAGKGDVKELQVTPLVPGRGPRVTAGQQLTVNYVGVTFKDGKVFDSSWSRGEPVTFPIGTGNLIKGWDEGLVGQPVGSRLQLDIPAEKAYGEKPTGGQPAGDLRFVVHILQAQG